MARVACHHVSSQASPRVLIGGLGLGYTLRAALDRLPEQASVVCVELMEAIVEWHAGPLGPLAEHPTADPRVEVVVADVVEHLQRETGDFDAILLDVDNGPIPMTVYSNGWLYTAEGLARLRGLLRPGGVLTPDQVAGMLSELQENGELPALLRRYRLTLAGKVVAD